MMRVLLLMFLLVGCGENPSIATYDIEPELFWLQKYGVSEIMAAPEYTSTIYYEPISKIFYFATIEKIKNITYETNNIINENAVIDHIPSWEVKPNERNTDLVYYPIEDPLIYVGSINLTNRIYIDSKSNQYIKKLTEIDTSYYIDYEDHKQSIVGSLLPFITQKDIYDIVPPQIALSNQFNQVFVIGNLRPDPNISNRYPNGTLYLKYYD
ncbi:MAG: hypothetical protein ACRCWI_03810 [Brevinema sp.]